MFPNSKTLIKLTLFLIFFTTYANSLFSQSQEVLINEFLASNSSINTDPDFNAYADWLELFNPQNETADLSFCYLTDNLDNPTKWQFPDGASLAPGEFLIIWADGNNVVLEDYHTNFLLSKSGEEIGLFDSNQVLIDKIVYEDQNTDISFGRQPDGGPNWYFFNAPTPGETNNTSIFLKTDPPQFSLAAGYYTEDQTLEISTDDPLASIRYTINGNEPTVTSPVYSTPLLLQSRAGEANMFSEIRTNRDPYLWLPDWVPPSGKVFKANIIRARSFKDGYNPSDIISRTFFVDENIDQRYPTLPVISIISDHRHLFSSITGIYVPGIYHRPGDSGSGNYFQDWEKPVHIEFFEPGGTVGFSQDVGMSIQGGTSPASPQKGLHIIARSEYGKNRIEYPIFQNDSSKAKNLTEFKRFIIRAWGSLISGALFNDAYAQRLMAKRDIDIMAYQPAVVFINGEYWGLHALREANKNSWYYQYHYHIDRDDPGYDILIHSSSTGQNPTIDEGDADHWNALINYLNTHDMTIAENYDYLKTQIDMDNFITWLGHCIYLGKWDWPNNNDASWRPRTADGKWRWIQYDMETGFGVATTLGPEYASLGPQLNMLEAAIEGVYIPGFGIYGPHPILAKIYNNEEFKASFIDWFEARLNHEFLPDSMNNILEEMAAEIRPYMEEYKQRWPFIGGVNNEWATSLEQIKEYNQLRPAYMREHLQEQYDSEIIIPLPLDYKLLQNYPNPFNHKTIINYELEIIIDVELSVYNLLGQKVATLVSETQDAGPHQVEWDATGFSTGMYYYKIEAGEFRGVRKMILLK